MFIVLQYLLFLRIVSIDTSIKVLDKGLMPLEKKSVAIQFYFDIENKDKLNACKLRSIPKICCLSDNEDIDCDTMEIYGDYHDILKPKYRDTVLYIYPTMVQHDQVGYCSFILEYRCGNKKSKRDAVKISFDTRLRNKSQYTLKEYANGQEITPCETLDQDSLNQCSPVICDAKYSGHRPFFDTEKETCVRAVKCLTDPKQHLPDVVYMPKSNTCRDLNNPLTIADIYAMSTGLGIVTESPENEEFKVTLLSNCSTISQNLMFLKDLLYGKLFPMKLKADFSKSCNAAVISILSCIFCMSLVILLFVMFVAIIAWAYKNYRNGELKKKTQDLINKLKPFKQKNCKKKMSKINDDVKNKLLREVIVSDLPLELRDSMEGICDRLGKEVKWKRRYRTEDVGSRVSFKEINPSDTSTTSDLDYEEKQKLLK